MWNHAEDLYNRWDCWQALFLPTAFLTSCMQHPGKMPQKIHGLSPEAITADEDYWGVIQQSYTVDSNLIILEQWRG
jgi:hypothetical protein